MDLNVRKTLPGDGVALTRSDPDLAISLLILAPEKVKALQSVSNEYNKIEIKLN